MKQNELTKKFMMIEIEKPSGLHSIYKNMSAI